jgi:hypothetical protein
VPLLTLLFGVDMRYALGASLVSVIATSSGAAAAYVKEGYTNIRIGMRLEIATTPERWGAPGWPRGFRRPYIRTTHGWRFHRSRPPTTAVTASPK